MRTRPSTWRGLLSKRKHRRCRSQSTPETPSLVADVGGIELAIPLDKEDLELNASSSPSCYIERVRAVAWQLAEIAQELGNPAPHQSEEASSGKGEITVTRAELLEATRYTYRMRRLREKLFASDLFGEPAWDMLLDLYANALVHKQVTTTSLCIASAVPQTTALRWIGQLAAAGLVRCDFSEVDSRVRYQVLTDRGEKLMTRYFTRLVAIEKAALDAFSRPVSPFDGQPITAGAFDDPSGL